MIKTLNPYSNTSKTAEIMSRYRPIAPKPENPGNENSSSMSQKIRESPYLRNLWPQLQARPTRTRKRVRASISPGSLKRARTHVLGLSSPCHLASSPAKNLSLQGFAQFPVPNLIGFDGCLDAPATKLTLPLLPCPNQAAVPELDLNTAVEIPEEKDLLQQLQGPSTSNVIAPQPIRPVGSSIRVGCISEDLNSVPTVQLQKKPEEVEEEVESEILPVVISDSNNKVRMANSAYKEMVGQPECSWLEGRLGGRTCSRISGEVMLHLANSDVPVSSNGFSCWVRIEWGCEGKKDSIRTFCDVKRLSCESKDYLFTWRFHIHSKDAK